MRSRRTGASLALVLVMACGNRDQAADFFCGDGTRDAGEICDDGNNASGDGCRADCARVEVCGDGTLDAGEECDDGNALDGDGCRPGCLIAACGDGILDPGEGCDDGNAQNGDACSAACQLDTCGNDADDPGERCFTPRQLLAAGGLPFGLAAADLDADGDLDLVSSDVTSGVNVFTNDGAGVFATAQPVPIAGGSPFSVVALDLDEDGDIDVATADNGFDEAGNPTIGALSVLLNDGAGNLALAGRVPTAADLLFSLSAADIDGDGLSELVSQGALNALVVVFPNLGGGAFGAPQEILLPEQFFFGSQPFGVAAGDLDGDGAADILVADGGALTVRVLRNDGAGDFTLEDGLAAGIGAQSVALGDTDGDGDLDGLLLAPGLRSASVLHNPGDGRFDRSTSGVALGPFSGSLLDLGGDGQGEVLTADGGDVFGANPGRTLSLFQIGAAGLVPLVRVEIGVGPTSALAADLNGDQRPDLAAVVLGEASVAVVLGAR